MLLSLMLTRMGSCLAGCRTPGNEWRILPITAATFSPVRRKTYMSLFSFRQQIPGTFVRIGGAAALRRDKYYQRDVY
jgi:hypothetical protein